METIYASIRNGPQDVLQNYYTSTSTSRWLFSTVVCTIQYSSYYY
jgi:hypothetical protein